MPERLLTVGVDNSRHSLRDELGLLGTMHSGLPFTLKMRVEYDAVTLLPTYQGWALPGTHEENSEWVIVAYTYDGNNQAVETNWANGNLNFDKSWALRARYSYS